MTCEICGKSQMNVATYTIPFIPIKLDCCTLCIRNLEGVCASIEQKAKDDMRSYIEELIEARKKIEAQKR